jgi:hypothetical protein
MRNLVKNTPKVVFFGEISLNFTRYCDANLKEINDQFFNKLIGNGD